ncbi:MAG: RnfABCDGE type electron transport complex subunit G [Firmicutes bacterium]|nr:RnfABCDGE type electron transport complex subunit G [Bacillota bacterium]
MGKELRLVLVLTIICVVSAAVLGWINFLTEPVIKDQRELAKQKALQEVLPTATEFQAEPALIEDISQSGVTGIMEIYRGFSGEEQEGFVFTVDQQGYASVIRMVVGVTLDGKLAGLSVISQTETPGLGAEVTDEEFLSQPAFRRAKIGDQLGVTKDNGEVEAIASATISSRAVVRGVNAALTAAGLLLAEENGIGGVSGD